jgi:NAD(P)-dependent dehydrogenase (short-subunit alcohol dehydrogenase family)
MDGKTAVIVGASRGVGRSLCEEFAAAGARVVFCARSTSKIKDLENQLTARGFDVCAVEADISKPDDCRNVIDTAIERFGRIDILINNAAVAGPTKLIHDLELDEWTQVLTTNLTSLYLTIHFATRHMIDQGDGGVILNIGSMTGKRPLEGRAAYAASKLGVVGLTRTVALEMGPYKIRCNTLSPGPIAGERVDEVIAAAAKASGKSEAEIRAGILAWSPLGEMVDDIDIARMALFLCSNLGARITGQDVNVNAGAVMY